MILKRFGGDYYGRCSDYLVGVLSENEQFTYDDLGNRLTLNNRAGSDVVYTHNNVNEYSAIGGESLTYDDAGNLTEDHNDYEYIYDYENRLTEITKSGNVTKAAYTYDALGRRIEKIAGGTTTHYYYDGWRVLAETDENDDWQQCYTYGNYLDEVLIMTVEDSPDVDHYYVHDHLFSVAALIAADGTIEERYEYDAYGKCKVYTDDGDDDTWFTLDDTIASVSAQGNPYTFTGQRLDNLDSNSLLIMYYKNRYYLVDIGRFIQRDPLGTRDGICIIEFTPTGSPIFPRGHNSKGQYNDGMSLYEYVESKPVVKLDTFGLTLIPFHPMAKNKHSTVCCKVMKPGHMMYGFAGAVGIPDKCEQKEIANPKLLSPDAACKCKFKSTWQQVTFYGKAEAGPCCWCDVYKEIVSATDKKDTGKVMGFPSKHATLYVVCNKPGMISYNLDVTPQGDTSIFLQGEAPLRKRRVHSVNPKWIGMRPLGKVPCNRAQEVWLDPETGIPNESGQDDTTLRVSWAWPHHECHYYAEHLYRHLKACPGTDFYPFKYKLY